MCDFVELSHCGMPRYMVCTFLWSVENFLLQSGQWYCAIRCTLGLKLRETRQIACYCWDSLCNWHQNWQLALHEMPWISQPSSGKPDSFPKVLSTYAPSQAIIKFQYKLQYICKLFRIFLIYVICTQYFYVWANKLQQYWTYNILAKKFNKVNKHPTAYNLVWTISLYNTATISVHIENILC